MLSRPPFFAQSRPDSCTLACLRMLLAHRGISVTEAELIEEVAPLVGGLPLEDLVQLVQRRGLHAEIQELDVTQLAHLVDHGTFPIAYVDRSPFDGEFSVHAVIPVRVTRDFVAFLDPLRGERRVSKRKFEAG